MFNYIFAVVFICVQYFFWCSARPITPHVLLLPGKKEKKSNEEKDKTESGNPHGAGCGVWMGQNGLEMGMSQNRNAPSSLFLIKKEGLGAFSYGTPILRHSHIKIGLDRSIDRIK